MSYIAARKYVSQTSDLNESDISSITSEVTDKTFLNGITGISVDFVAFPLNPVVLKRDWSNMPGNPAHPGDTVLERAPERWRL